MKLIDADVLMKELGITSDDCCECEWGDGHGYCTRTSDFTEACDAICTALPIEPEPQWIPCSEPPKESGTYIVTAYDGTNKRVSFVKYQKTLKRWDLTGARAYWRILAYRHLPKPWRGESNDRT